MNYIKIDISLYHKTNRAGGNSLKYGKFIMKAKKISISDFSFSFSGYGHYRVTYTSPITGKSWSTVTNNMPLIDATKNADEPKRCDLESLKYLVKNA